MEIAPRYTLIFIGLTLIFMGIIYSRPEYRHSNWFGVLAAIATLNLGILTVSMAQNKVLANHYTRFEINKIHCWHLKVRKVLKSNYNDRYLVRILGIDSLDASGQLLLTIPIRNTEEQLSVDDEIMLWTSAKALRPPLNPHQFDYAEYMSGLGILHQIQLKSRGFYKKTTKRRTIIGLAAKLRNTIKNRLQNAGIQAKEMGIIQALLLGERKEIDAEVHANYKNAGALHMLAVSGLHVGIILLLLDFLLQPIALLKNGKKIKLAVIVFLLWSFAILAGLSASVVRAVTMFSFIAYALYLNRPSNTFNILALSMFFILLVFDPLLLFQVGFQMSYLAVIFIVWIYPLLQRFWHPRNKLVLKLWQLFSVSLSAQLGVLPISLYYFHQFPGLFFVSNLIVIPFLGLILGLGIAIIIMSLINILPGNLAICYGRLIELMNAVISWVAQQDDFIIKDISFDGTQLLILYFIICFFIILLSKINFRNSVLLLSAIIGFQWWGFYLFRSDIKRQRIVILHQIANSIILHQNGRELSIYSRDSTRSLGLTGTYRVAERISQIAHRPLKNSYKIAEKRLLIVDSLGILPANHESEIVLLTQSPRINLERYLNNNTPQLIIADGSNYLNLINRWKKTSKQKKVPFHYTGEKGAYFIKSAN